jgi:7-carboxy-7-deazaguanine synthase (Cx14CxxC type)
VGYHVKETYLTLQGEGAQAGRAAVFCRFTGCNLWSGLEGDRASAACRFCDTDFRGTDGPGGGVFSSAEGLAEHIRTVWDEQTHGGTPYVVFTGGEPSLQLDDCLVAACRSRGFTVGIETNGTRPIPCGIDWVCVSPKAHNGLRVREGHELKLVFPQTEVHPSDVEELRFQHFFLQPMDGSDRDSNTLLAVAYCRAHPRWRLSLQTHKLVGIP